MLKPRSLLSSAGPRAEGPRGGPMGGPIGGPIRGPKGEPIGGPWDRGAKGQEAEGSRADIEHHLTLFQI